MKLLIAEDTKTLQLMLQAITSAWQYEPVLASDGQEAWNILQADEPPKLILLDWEMPIIDGSELCRKILTKNTDDPPYIIMLTSRTDTHDIVEGLDAGANDYVVKPFNNSELQARLKVGVRMLTLQSELKQANQKLVYQATYDSLTELPNRRAIMEELDNEIARAQREQNCLYIALGDIDHFKKINDTYGHPAGDKVLKDVSNHFRQTLRPYDKVGRYGGEEFLFIVNGESNDVFDRICQNIANTPIQLEDQSISTSISLGVVKFDLSSQNNITETLLKKADIALYQAKTAGRNQVIYSD